MLQVGETVRDDMGTTWFVSVALEGGCVHLDSWFCEAHAAAVNYQDVLSYAPMPRQDDGPCQHTRRGYIGPMHGWACYHCGEKLS